MSQYYFEENTKEKCDDFINQVHKKIREENDKILIKFWSKTKDKEKNVIIFQEDNYFIMKTKSDGRGDYKKLSKDALFDEIKGDDDLYFTLKWFGV